jgi:hypothetical protein
MNAKLTLTLTLAALVAEKIITMEQADRIIRTASIALEGAPLGYMGLDYFVSLFSQEAEDDRA